MCQSPVMHSTEAPAPPDATRDWDRPAPYDFVETTRMLRTGARDPTVRRLDDGLWRTAHTTDGPCAVRITVGERIRAAAWGPGAAAALDDVPRWIGLHEPPWTLPPHPVTDRLLRAHPGVRGTDTRDVFEALTWAILQQKVLWEEAVMMWRRLCETYGAPAPGPEALRLSPTRKDIFRAGVPRLQALGIGFAQARTLVALARVAPSLQAAADRPTAEAITMMQSVRGIGPWTAAFCLGMRFGRPDPLPVGDYHIPNMVAWALAGEPRADDARMAALLAPFEGHAFRVVRLLFAARIQAPRRGPRRGWSHGRGRRRR